MLARLDEKLLQVEIVKDGAVSQDNVASLGQSVHLIVEEGLEAYLPLADMIDYAKERVRKLFLTSRHFVLQSKKHDIVASPFTALEPKKISHKYNSNIFNAQHTGENQQTRRQVEEGHRRFREQTHE